MKRLSRADIHVGNPLPFSAYDKNGRLLLRKGVVVAFQHQIERLIDDGLFMETTSGNAPAVSPPREELTPVFDEIGSLALRLKLIFTSLSGASPAEDIAEQVIVMAQKIHAACARDAEAACAAAHLDFYNSYLLSHHIHSAVLCSLLGHQMDMPNDDLMPVICAALTYDIGLIDMPYLEKQLEPLSEEQNRVVRRHPLKSVETLKRAGIDNEIWISAVLDHHERLNGKGYPRGLAGDIISIGARMLGLADSYLAMIKSRPFREAKVPLMVTKEIFNEKDSNFGDKLCKSLVKALGMYPPGSIVRLVNGEIAVVKGRSANMMQPHIFSVYDASGMPFMSPRERDSSLDECAVKAPVAHSECRAVELIMRRLWTK